MWFRGRQPSIQSFAWLLVKPPTALFERVLRAQAMDFDEQDDLRRKRMRFLEDLSSDSTGAEMPRFDVIGDAIKARQLQFALDHASDRRMGTPPSNATPSPTPAAESAESSHPNQDEVIAAYARGEHAGLFSLLVDFDRNSKYNKPEKSFDSSARIKKPKSARKDNGTGYGGSDEDFYPDMNDSMFGSASPHWGPSFAGQGFTLDNFEPYVPKDPHLFQDLAPKTLSSPSKSSPKKKKIIGFGSFGGGSGFAFSGASTPWTTIGQKSKSIFAHNFKGVGHSLGLSVASKDATKQNKAQDEAMDIDEEEEDIEDKQMSQNDDDWGNLFGGVNLKHIKRPTKAKEEKQEESIKPDEDDIMTARTFARVVELLPFLGENAPTFLGRNDTKPSTIVPSIIRCSSILDRAAELLRHSTLDEIAGKTELYQELHNFVYALAQHPLTAPLVLEDRIAHRPGQSIWELVHKLPTAGISEMSASSLFRCMRNLAKMADAELNNADIDTGSLNLLCSFDTTYKALLQDINSPVEEETNPNAWQAELRFAVVQDDIMQARHSLFSTEASNSSVAKTRMRRIGQEIKDLRENLPDGIFIRVAESRPDLMKILIIGPQGTPYENGLFEFDLLCQNHFPTSPPRLEFRTTGGGRVRFNPNLYDDGTVCLSLLGTWSGEPWDSEKSTIRQVLVSIQAMIFCDSPWRNEPGRELLETSHPLVMEHNRELRPHTVQFALLAWLEAEEDGIWGEVVRKHFAAKEAEIRSCVEGWAQEPKSRLGGVLGTGWVGEMEMEGEEVVGDDLVAHLKRVLPALKRHGASSRSSALPGFGDSM